MAKHAVWVHFWCQGCLFESKNWLALESLTLLKTGCLPLKYENFHRWKSEISLWKFHKIKTTEFNVVFKIKKYIFSADIKIQKF